MKTSTTPKTANGLIQKIRMDKSTGQNGLSVKADLMRSYMFYLENKWKSPQLLAKPLLWSTDVMLKLKAKGEKTW